MSLLKKTIKGLTWSGISQGLKILSQFIVTAILARLVSPNDFGLLAMAMVFVNFVAIFGEMGLSSALIQKQDAHARHYYSAFWLNVVVGIFLTFIFIGISPTIAWFYKKPELQPILIVMSINFIISSFVIIQQTILTKEMDFKRLAIRDIIAVVLSGVIGIYLAFQGLGVWSLVIQSITFTLFNAVLLWVLSSWRPKFEFAWSDIKDIVNFSAHLTGFNIFNYFARNIDQLLIGKFLGAQALGYYSLAYKIMLYPLQNISRMMGKVMFPAFSKIQDDLGKVRNAYLKMLKSISLLCFPLLVGLFALAPEFVKVILGYQWHPIIIILRVFCVCGIVQSINTTVGNIILSQGYADLQFRFGYIGAFFVFIAVLIGLQWGILGVAITYTFEQLLWAFYTQRVTNSLITLNFNNFLPVFKNSFKIAICLLILIPIKLFLGKNQLIVLSLSILIGTAIYFYFLLTFNEISFSKKRIHAVTLEE